MSKQDAVEVSRFRSTFRTSIIARAEETSEHLTGGFGKIDALLEDYSLVFAVWPDKNFSDGAGVLVVKGEYLLRGLSGSLVANGVLWTALACVSAEQAEALRRLILAPTLLH